MYDPQEFSTVYNIKANLKRFSRPSYTSSATFRIVIDDGEKEKPTFSLGIVLNVPISHLIHRSEKEMRTIRL